MPDQADNLRQLIHRTTPTPVPVSAPRSPMIVVTGGRPGVGTTTVAVNLAAVLADGGERVLLVDAARERNNLAEAAGVTWANIEHPLSDVLQGKCTAAEAVAPGPAGTQLLAASGRVSSRRGCESRRDSPTWSRADFSRQAQQRLIAELQSLRSDFDIFVIDLGSGLNSWTRRFWLQANLVLLVTTTDSSALMDAYAMIKLSVADEFGPDIRLVVNHYEDDGIAEGAYRRLSNACGRFLARTLPAVPSLPRYVDDGGANPLPRVWETTDTPFGHAMLWLGRAVGDVLSEKSSTPIVMSAA